MPRATMRCPGASATGIGRGRGRDADLGGGSPSPTMAAALKRERTPGEAEKLASLAAGNLARRRAAEKARRGRAQGGPPAGRDKQGPDPAGVRTKASSGGRAWRQGRREETGRTWRGREAQGPKGATASEVGGHGAVMSA